MYLALFPKKSHPPERLNSAFFFFFFPFFSSCSVLVWTQFVALASYNYIANRVPCMVEVEQKGNMQVRVDHYLSIPLKDLLSPTFFFFSLCYRSPSPPPLKKKKSLFKKSQSVSIVRWIRIITDHRKLGTRFVHWVIKSIHFRMGKKNLPVKPFFFFFFHSSPYTTSLDILSSSWPPLNLYLNSSGSCRSSATEQHVQCASVTIMGMCYPQKLFHLSCSRTLHSSLSSKSNLHHDWPHPSLCPSSLLSISMWWLHFQVMGSSFCFFAFI